MSQTRAVSRRGTRLAASVRSGPLGIPAFRLLTAGQFTSTIGDFCYAVALPWLVLSNHGSAAQLGVVLACYGLPRAVLTVPGGSLADRFGPRRVMLGSDAVRCALTAVFAVLAASHVSSLAALAPVAAVLGACAALFLPASAALMPTLVDAERLPTANAVYTGSLQFGMLLGPVIGGVLVAATGTTAAFGVDSASYAVSAASLALMAASGRRRSPAGESAGLAPAPGLAGAGLAGAGAGSAGAGAARRARARRVLALRRRPARRRAFGFCCGRPGSCSSSSRSRSPRTSRSSGPPRSRSRRWRTRGSARTVMAPSSPAWRWAASPARSSWPGWAGESGPPRSSPARSSSPLSLSRWLRSLAACRDSRVPSSSSGWHSGSTTSSRSPCSSNGRRRRCSAV